MTHFQSRFFPKLRILISSCRRHLLNASGHRAIPTVQACHQHLYPRNWIEILHRVTTSGTSGMQGFRKSLSSTISDHDCMVLVAYRQRTYFVFELGAKLTNGSEKSHRRQSRTIHVHDDPVSKAHIALEHLELHASKSASPMNMDDDSGATREKSDASEPADSHHSTRKQPGKRRFAHRTKTGCQ